MKHLGIFILLVAFLFSILLTGCPTGSSGVRPADAPAETAQKIVSYYRETHVYSSYDLFVCSDMAAEVWNMLKAAGIDSIIAVGRIDASIGDILDSNHAWVLAEVGSGQFLALETTGGFAVSTVVSNARN